MKVNVNEIIVVFLTRQGLRVLLNSRDSESLYDHNLDKGTVRLSMQLWHFMSVFGPHMHLGMDGPLFEDNSIVLDKEE